jgi:hypothetical protein
VVEKLNKKTNLFREGWVKDETNRPNIDETNAYFD